ncbi:dsDNA nuclease domain-containing protein [Shewanella sp. 1180_01]|uniref:dsDNA nuclease domain-containing protein n=1 Tax=Shewanella sp. 1180_01 TaxID=2604451 RepID=UPI004062AF90
MAGSEAQSGFYYQNLVAALYILELIEIDSNISSVTLENPGRAPHIDDIIIDTEKGSRFIQVKWSKEQESSFTLANLIAAEEGKGSLWEKLARGYQQICAEQGEKIVELLSTRREGSQKQPQRGFEYSLKQFITEFHEPYISNLSDIRLDSVSSHQKYSATLLKLKEASGITDDEVFSAFLKSLRFKLGEDDIDTVTERVKAKIHRLGIEQQQFGNLLDCCVRWSINSKQVTASLVLRELGLEDRFAEKLNHRFPVDNGLWVPTPDLFAALDESLGTLSSGFVVVIGEPGAGKSTTLTKYLQENSNIKFGYYCFIPDDKTLGNDRLQEDAFVQSVCSGLRAAFPDFNFSKPYSNASVQLLNSWLKELSSSNEKVIFLVDGIDHVDRKSRQSLLSKPLTSVLDGQVPDNVLILLTTRDESALPPSINIHLKQQPCRRIEVKRFTREQVSKFMDLRGVIHNDKLLSQICTISAGVPIYLEYLAKTLFEMSEVERQQYLEKAPTLRGEEIDHYHEHMWQEWSLDINTKYLLAILAVREEYTTVEMLQNLLANINHSLSLGEVKQQLGSIRYVLKVSEAKGFSIHHASLTEFILNRTVELNTEITEAILSWFENNPTSDEAWRHRFRHLLELKRYNDLVQACDHDWVNFAWQCHRPLSEIQNNLDLAWSASVESLDLLSFIRIGLMKQQAGLIEQNTDLKSVEIATALLDIGEANVALNAIWDGERALVSTAEFAGFAVDYEALIGRSLPVSMILQVFSDRKGNGYKAAVSIFRVLSLVKEPIELMDEIGQLCWKSESDTGYFVDTADKLKNERVNLNLQLKVLENLAQHCSIDKLIMLDNHLDSDNYLSLPCKAALSVAFAKAGSLPDAVSTLNGFNFEKLPKKFFFWTQLQLAQYHVPFTKLEAISVPSIPKAIDKEHKFNPDLAKALFKFKGYLLNCGNDVTLLRSQCAGLIGPIANINHALIALAELWVKSVGEPRSAANLIEIKSLCDQLSISVGSFDRVNSYHSNLYNYHAHELYQHLWDYAKEFLDCDSQLELASHWLSVEDGFSCSRFYIATRQLARMLADNKANTAEKIKRRLLEVVEKEARDDEETMVITSSLIESARAWGVCDFKDDAIRIWSEIPDIACGVHHRKDYQFNQIFLALVLAHEQDPLGSYERLKEQLELAYQLKDTGSAKQVAIAIEEILELVAQWFPALVFKGLREEDQLIFRERGLRGTLSKLVTNPTLDKRLLLAVLKTMSRWGNHNHFNDETAPAMLEFYSSLLEQTEYKIADETYQFARQLFLVEKQLPELLGQWAKLRNEAQSDNDLARCDEEIFGVTDASTNSQQHIHSRLDDSKEKIKVELDKLTPGDFVALTTCLEILDLNERKKDIERRLARDRNDWLNALLKVTSLESIPTDLEQETELFFKSFENKVLQLFISNSKASREEFDELIVEAINKFALLVDVELRSGDASILDEVFNVSNWIDGLHRPLKLDYFIQRELESKLPDWINQSTFSQLDPWLDFSRDMLTSDALALALVELAKRYKLAKPLLAFELLEEARDCISSQFFESGELGKEVCRLAIELNVDKGSRLILESFRYQYSKYPTSLIYRLGSLVEALSSTMKIDGVELYNVCTSHNKRLAKGLKLKPIEESWLVDEKLNFEEEAIGYLLAMLKYPEVDIRLLTVEALVNLLSVRFDLIESVHTHWPNLTCGQREYVISIFDSLGRLNPELVDKWASWLLDEVELDNHYNQRKALVLAYSPDEFRGRAAHPRLNESLKLIEVPTVISLLPPQVIGESLSNLRWTPYFRWSLKELSDCCSVTDMFYSQATKVLKSIYLDAEDGLDHEAVIHRSHNINDNFDTIEIAATFDESCRDSINKTIMKLISSHEIDMDSLNNQEDILRVRDPSDSLIKPVSRPKEIDWLSEDCSDEDFINFSDTEKTIKAALNVQDGFIRLFEYTEHRAGDEIGSQSQRVCIAQIEMFGLETGDNLPQDLIAYGFEHSRIRNRNAYRFELPWCEGGALPGVVPLVSSTSRRFRGRKTRELAALSGTWKGVFPNAQSMRNYLGAEIDGSELCRAIEWQDEFAQGRRLHEPKSTGFLLEVDLKSLKRLASELKLEIFARVKLSRTIDKYKPECTMDWRDTALLVKVF